MACRFTSYTPYLQSSTRDIVAVGQDAVDGHLGEGRLQVTGVRNAELQRCVRISRTAICTVNLHRTQPDGFLPVVLSILAFLTSRGKGHVACL